MPITRIHTSATSRRLERRRASALGFPHSKRVYLDPMMRWRFPEYWRQRMVGQVCSYRDFGRDIITVVSLTPML